MLSHLINLSNSLTNEFYRLIICDVTNLVYPQNVLYNLIIKPFNFSNNNINQQRYICFNVINIQKNLKNNDKLFLRIKENDIIYIHSTGLIITKSEMERFNYTQPINIESNLNNIINGEYDNIYSEYKLLHNITLTDKPINNICILINELLLFLNLWEYLPKTRHVLSVISGKCSASNK